MSRFKRIRRSDRLRIREIAREAYHEADGRKDVALTLAESRVRFEYESIVSMILINLMVKLAISLILYWLENRFATVPAGGFLEGEPGS